MNPIERYIDDAVHHFERGQFASGVAYLASAKDEASRKPRLHIIRSDQGDWIALYRDGKLLRQGHSIQEEELLSLLDFEYGHTEWNEADFEKRGGRCPDDLLEGL